MSKFLLFCTTVVASIAISSCTNNSEEEYLPFQSRSEGRWGLIDAKGNVLFQEEFEQVPTSVLNGRFIVENKNGYWELFSAEEKPQKIGQDYSDILSFTSSVTPAVVKGGKIQIIDTDGKNVATLDKADGKNIIECSNFTNDYAVIETEDGLCGIINHKGNMVVSPKYASAEIIEGGVFVCTEQSEKDEEIGSRKLIFFNNSGEEITSLRIGEKEKYYDVNLRNSDSEHIAISIFSDDNGEECGFIDYGKKQIVKPSSKITAVGSIKNKNFLYRNDEGLWGVQDLDGNIIIRAKYESMEWASDERLVVCSGDKEYSLIDLDDNKLTTETYLDYVFFGENQNIAVKLDKNSWGIIDMRGQEIKIDKNVDIHNIERNLRTGFVESEFVDTESIISELNISNDGIGKFNLNMLPENAVKFDTNKEFSDDANYWKSKNEVSYTLNSIRGVNIEIKALYEYFLVDCRFYDFDANIYRTLWSTDKPAIIGAEVSGYKLQGKAKKIFNAIAKRIKPFGSVIKESDNTVIVKISDTKGWIINHTDNQVDIALINHEQFQMIANSMFENGTSLSSVSDIPASASADTSVYVDSVPIYDEYANDEYEY